MSKHKRVLSPQEIKEARAAGIKDSVVDAAVEFADLTPKQKALAIEMMKNPGATALEQVKNAGYSVTKKARPQQLKKQLAGRLALTLKEFGIFEDDLAKVAADGLKATTVKIIKVAKRNESGMITSEEIEYHEIPDYATRLATFRTLCALGDYFPAKKLKIDATVDMGVFAGIDPRILEQRKRELENKEKAIDAKFSVEAQS